MLDENLPAYILKPSSTGLKHQRELYLTYQGSDPAPAYTIRGADPLSPAPAHKNCYAAAIFDAYNPDVLYGEVLARPGWTQPTLSAEEMRKNGGIPPPPQPILPYEFVVQLYNPDQQVRVDVKEGKWGSSDSYEFSMPQSTFRTPSASNIDRSQDDPTSLAITPKLNFVWRKDSKLGKDLSCFMVGKSTDTHERRRARKDPDIALGLWRNLRELTVYEPNLTRLDMEDPKGFEIVLILSAVVIKDLYFSGGAAAHLKDLFNIAHLPTERKLSGGGRKLSHPHQPSSWISPAGPTAAAAAASSSTPSLALPTSTPILPSRRSHDLPSSRPPVTSTPPPPMADPRSQWELDAETARLKAAAAAEQRALEKARRDRERADEAERRRLQRMVEDEERAAARRRQDEVDRETERLRQLYGTGPTRDGGNGGGGGGGAGGTYPDSAVYMSGANQSLPVSRPQKKKSTFFGLMGGGGGGSGSGGEEERRHQQQQNDRNRLTKRPSAMW